MACWVCLVSLQVRSQALTGTVAPPQTFTHHQLQQQVFVIIYIYIYKLKTF